MYSAITPYLVPGNLPKKVNIGDGFIMDSSIKLIQKNQNFYFLSKPNEYKLYIDKFITKVKEII